MRRQRRRGKQIIQNALDGIPPSHKTSDATEAILVLQKALRNAPDRHQKMVETAKLEKTQRKLEKAKAKIEELKEQVDVAEADEFQAQTATTMHQHHHQE